MQLIKIVNVPIEYKVEIEHARLQLKTGTSPEIAAPDVNLQAHHKNAQIRQDTVNLNLPGRQQESSQQNTVAETQQADLQQGSSTPQTVAAQSTQQPAPVVVKKPVTVPSTGNTFKWSPSKEAVEYEPGAITFDWNKLQGTMQYVPGEISFKILQYPDVEIEYVGGPNYVPPSADPNYQE